MVQNHHSFTTLTQIRRPLPRYLDIQLMILQVRLMISPQSIQQIPARQSRIIRQRSRRIDSISRDTIRRPIIQRRRPLDNRRRDSSLVSRSIGVLVTFCEIGLHPVDPVVEAGSRDALDSAKCAGFDTRFVVAVGEVFDEFVDEEGGFLDAVGSILKSSNVSEPCGNEMQS